jgi:adenylosuccinate synthase
VVVAIKPYLTAVGTHYLITNDGHRSLEILQREGREFGSITGRKREVGWLDVVALKTSLLGVARVCDGSVIALNKLDILDSLPEIKVCVAYRNRETGDLVELCLPASVEEAQGYEPVFATYAGWQSPTAKAKTWDSLPSLCQVFIQSLEVLIGLPIKYIGTGPEVESYIKRK